MHRHRTAGGEERPVEIFSTPIPLGGQDVLFAILHDITERDRMERELREYAARLEGANKNLQEFASVASHDLQEPLRKVIAFGERVQSRYADELDERGQDYLKRVTGAAYRMRTLIEDLLDLSRVSTRERDFERVDLDALVDDLLEMFEVCIEESGARVDIERPLGAIEADSRQVRQLLQNLMSNALKFHDPEDRPHMEVRGQLVEASEGQRTHYRLSVRDHGIGMRPDCLSRIFDPFERLHGRSSCYDGTGIGLAICHKIVEQHRGNIEVETAPGEGTCFHITIPMSQPVE